MRCGGYAGRSFQRGNRVCMEVMMERDVDALREDVVALERHFAGLEDAVLDLWVLLHRRGHFKEPHGPDTDR